MGLGASASPQIVRDLVAALGNTGVTEQAWCLTLYSQEDKPKAEKIIQQRLKCILVSPSS